MDLQAWIGTVINTLKGAVPFAQVRSPATAVDRLEAVVLREDLPRCLELLQQAFGPPAKTMGTSAKLERGLQAAIDDMGGVRADQGLFLKVGPQQLAYAMLWPWESDQTRVTLKIGIAHLSDK